MQIELGESEIPEHLKEYFEPVEQEAVSQKNLMGIPWRVALALQADGWYLRSSIIWAKGISFCPTWSGSCMPESTKDRPTKSYENVFLLAKKERYFYDHVAVREASAGQAGQAASFARETKDHLIPNQTVAQHRMDREPTTDNGTRNLRSVWTIGTGGGYKADHFAVYPAALVEPMIKAGTSQRGCCPKCLSPWERVTEKASWNNRDERRGLARGDAHIGQQQRIHNTNGLTSGTTVTTTGWIPTCSCDAGEPVPCTVLDPFLGSGTTSAVADFLGRHSVGIELSKTYCDDHIIPRLSEPLFEWAEQERAEQEQCEPEPVVEQMGLL